MISYLSDGTLISIVVFYAFAIRYEQSISKAVGWTALTLIFSTFIPFAAIFYSWRRGWISSFHLDKREERWKFFVISILSALVGAIILYEAGAPPVLTVAMINYVILGLVMMSITFFWKISLHASSITAFMVAVVMVFGIKYWWTLFFILPVLWARYYLKKHTAMQLLAGTFVSGVITFFTFSYFLNLIK